MLFSPHDDDRRVRTWHAGVPDRPRSRGMQDWRLLVAELHGAGDKSGADALEAICKAADAIRGRAQHWADVVLHGRAAGSVGEVGGSSAQAPYHLRCAEALMDVGRRLEEIRDDYGLGRR